MSKVEIINSNTNKKHKCVLCAVDTDKGRAIANDMLSWLSPLYEVHIVWHDGTQYEYPGLKYLQELCINSNEPCLYLHTRGAYNYHKNTTPFTHNMWKKEFGEKRNKYFDLVNTDQPTAACPFTGTDKYTWYNGFVVNPAAMKSVTIKPESNRLVYEYIFKGSDVNVRSTIYSNINGYDKLTPVRMYMKLKYK